MQNFSNNTTPNVYGVRVEMEVHVLDQNIKYMKRNCTEMEHGECLYRKMASISENMNVEGLNTSWEDWSVFLIWGRLWLGPNRSGQRIRERGYDWKLKSFLKDGRKDVKMLNNRVCPMSDTWVRIPALSFFFFHILKKIFDILYIVN